MPPKKNRRKQFMQQLNKEKHGKKGASASASVPKSDDDVDEDWVEEPEPLRTAHDPASLALGLSSGDDASDQELLDEERPDERSSRRARQALEPGVAAARESMAQRKRKSRSVTPTPAASSISSHFTPLAQKTPTSYSDESVADLLPPTRESGLRRKYLRAAVLGHRVASAQAPVAVAYVNYLINYIKAFAALW